MTNKLDQTVKAVRRNWRLQATISILAICGLYLSLPERLTLGPTWLLPAAVILLLIPTIVFHRAGRHTLNFVFGIAVLAIITTGLMFALGFLISGLPSKRQPPKDLLTSAAALWICNVLVFASWYWRLDAGGPHIRESRRSHINGAFLFPQMMLPEGSAYADSTWRPDFIDYLFLAFNTSTAFSPTDVPVLGRWAKVLMMVQSSISLATVAILAARAINIL
ncbi:MAG TPA: hypothetical protein VFA65_00120 [Bryobacteraceae bacterium]|nr:hypothetical protein [Bryobacteraceae bacterium]